MAPARNRWLRGLLVITAATIPLGGCYYHSSSKTTETERAVPGAVVVSPAERVMTYPEGRYELRGDGRTTPYYWVWIPAGATPPAPPPLPPTSLSGR
jgi:hypothetical protein